MKHIYAFEETREYDKYQAIIHDFTEKLHSYARFLEEDYALVDKPKGIVWTSFDAATTIFSDLPIPAFTNKDTIYISPDVKAWRKLFIQQLDGKNLPHIKAFYERLSENHLLTILGHELTHHSDLFMDEFEDEREDNIWFEEGMCEYIPRKFFLTESEFQEITAVESELVNAFQSKYGERSLNDFGSKSYQASISSIMFDYWRSFLTIKYLVEERYDHNIQAVFKKYQDWDKDGSKCTLLEHFELDNVFLGEMNLQKISPKVE